MLSLIDEYDGAEYVFRRVTPDLVGTWHFSFILAENGMVLNLAENGLPPSFTLNSDGTAQMNMEGEILNDFWQQKGNRVYDSSGSFFTYEDGMLIMEDEGYRIMLVRADAAKTDNKAPRPAKSAAEFDGHWVTCTIETIGVEIPASQIMMGFQIRPSIHHASG
ncbi:MAG: hypothetical protein E7324_03285 [Clostridiales bacterium]|nr:hypothetical protein [Clostridiales bacterium]